MIFMSFMSVRGVVSEVQCTWIKFLIIIRATVRNQTRNL